MKFKQLLDANVRLIIRSQDQGKTCATHENDTNCSITDYG